MDWCCHFSESDHWHKAKHKSSQVKCLENAVISLVLSYTKGFMAEIERLLHYLNNLSKLVFQFQIDSMQKMINRCHNIIIQHLDYYFQFTDYFHVKDIGYFGSNWVKAMSSHESVLGIITSSDMIWAYFWLPLKKIFLNIEQRQQQPWI